jgi:menaquinone-dependent protoporphyrinogen oxidase
VKVLVVFGTVRGGTQGIAERIADTLRKDGIPTDVRPAAEIRDLVPYDAVLVGGALYGFRWHADARRFVTRHYAALRTREVYFFSSGPLDESASRRVIVPVNEVSQLMRYVGARAHATFGGRLAPDAKGFPAAAMAKEQAGDHRDWPQIERWAREIAVALLGPAQPHPAPVGLPSRALPLGLALFVGLTAVLGGIGLMIGWPSSATPPVTLLAHSPFRSFLVPGAVLFSLVGLPGLYAAARHFSRDSFAPFASMVLGLSLTIWTVVEMAMLRTAEPLQLFYLGVAIAILLDAGMRLRPLVAEWKALARDAERAKATGSS